MLSAIIGTTVGKAVMAVVAVAAVGGGVVVAETMTSTGPEPADVVDVSEEESASEPEDDGVLDEDPATDELPDVATRGQEHAVERRAEADAFAELVRDWTSCVREAASARGEATSGEPFDPHEACGPNPGQVREGTGAPSWAPAQGPPPAPPAPAGPPTVGGPPAGRP